MKRAILLTAALIFLSSLASVLAIGCEPSGEWIDPDTVRYDAALDFALGPQTRRLGPRAPACCMVANSRHHVVYLSSPQPGRVSEHGVPGQARGEAHIASPTSGDFKLGTNVPGFGYVFAPDGRNLLFLSGTNDGTYALMQATVSAPHLLEPHPQVVIPRGLDDSDPLGSQGYFTPSGRFFVVGARAQDAANTADRNIIDVSAARVVYTLDKGAFSYAELVTFDDQLIYENSTASSTLGVPSVQGIYILPLLAAATDSRIKPTLVDTHATNPKLTADGTTLLYQRVNGELMMWDLKQNYYVKLADDVLAYSTGPGRKGPFVWIKKDLSVHVAHKLRPEAVSTPPNAADLYSPFQFSPERQNLYFYKNIAQQDNLGDLYHVKLPPVGDGIPRLIAPRASTVDFYFADRRMIYIRKVDTTGDTGELVSAELDGSDPRVMAQGVATGALQIAFPREPTPPPPPQGGFVKVPLDMREPAPPPVLANLVNASRNRDDGIVLIDNGRPVSGALAYGPVLSSAEVVIDPAVRAGMYQFTADGFVLIYVGDASYKGTVRNWTGTLKLFQTIADVSPVVPMLDGVSEMSQVLDRSLFVAAPGAAEPGLYFVKF